LTFPHRASLDENGELASTPHRVLVLALAHPGTKLVNAVQTGLGEELSRKPSGTLGDGKLMGNKDDKPRSEADAELEREIRKDRKFTLAEAIGRLAGPGAMKGESPIARMQQAEVEIESWLRSHLEDTGGALQVVLHRHVKGSELLLQNFEHPLIVLAEYSRRVLDSDYLLDELVREADIEWGRNMDERPYFEKAGLPCHPDDPYTVKSIRNALAELLKQLSASKPSHDPDQWNE
jgi:hypothetical protein